MSKSSRRTMYIVKTSCWKCKGAMNAAVISDYIEGNENFSYGPDGFSEIEMKIAEENDVVIKEQYSATIGEIYFANTCPNCSTFIGQHYLFTGVFCAAKYGDCDFMEIDLSL